MQTHKCLPLLGHPAAHRRSGDERHRAASPAGDHDQQPGLERRRGLLDARARLGRLGQRPGAFLRGLRQPRRGQLGLQQERRMAHARIPGRRHRQRPRQGLELPAQRRTEARRDDSRRGAGATCRTKVTRSLASFSTDPAVIYRWRDEMANIIEEAAGFAQPAANPFQMRLFTRRSGSDSLSIPRLPRDIHGTRHLRGLPRLPARPRLTAVGIATFHRTKSPHFTERNRHISPNGFDGIARK